MADTITLSSIRSQTTPGGRRNIVINGAMQVQQRFANTNDPTGVLATATYPLVDRIQVLVSNTSFTATANTNSLAQQQGFRKHLRFDVSSANTATSGAGDYFVFSTSIEGQDLQQVRKGTSNARPLALQFWVRSNVTGDYTLTANDIDNTRESSTIYTINSADTWEHKKLKIPADTTGVFDNDNNESLRLMWWISAVSGGSFSSGTHVNNTWTTRSNPNRLPTTQVQLNTNASNYFEITGIQLELDNHTPFEHRSYGEELAACQRYFQSWGGTQGSEYMPVFGNAYNSTTYEGVFKYIRTMRASPTFTASGSFEFNDVSANYSTGSLSGDVQALQSLRMRTTGASGLTQYRSYMLRANGTSARITLDAEL